MRFGSGSRRLAPGRARLSRTCRKRSKASRGKALPTATTPSQPPCSYTALAIDEPKAPPIKILVMYSAFSRLRLCASRA